MEAGIVNFIYAGPDGVIDPPSELGGTTGDDVLLQRVYNGSTITRIGTGYEEGPEIGQFDDTFFHNLPAGAVVYARAWDASTYLGAVAYGDSLPYTLSGGLSESHDFGTWIVGTPRSYEADTNGDTVPDYWYILHGMDPRDPVGPLTETCEGLEEFGAFGTSAGQFFNPSRVFYSDNFIFVLDSSNHRIQVWTRDTLSFVSSFGGVGNNDGQFVQPFGFFMDPRDGVHQIIVADTGNHRLQKLNYDPVSGAITFIEKWGSFGAASGEFSSPFGVSIGSDGRIYVADKDNHRVQAFENDGTFVWASGSFGSVLGEFSSPRGIAVESVGTLLVADTGNNRLQRLLSDGFATEVIGDSDFVAPYGVQVGFDDRIFVANTANSEVKNLVHGRRSATYLRWLGV